MQQTVLVPLKKNFSTHNLLRHRFKKTLQKRLSVTWNWSEDIVFFRKLEESCRTFNGDYCVGIVGYLFFINYVAGQLPINLEFWLGSAFKMFSRGIVFVSSICCFFVSGPA
jgi:hypothetical protein